MTSVVDSVNVAGPRTEAGREILASNRRVIEQLRESDFPHMVGEPIPQDALRTLVGMAEDEAADEARRLLGYLWAATGKNGRIPVSDLFDPSDPIVEDVLRLGIFPELSHD